jgi:hypothetical protein
MISGFEAASNRAGTSGMVSKTGRIFRRFADGGIARAKRRLGVTSRPVPKLSKSMTLG